MTKYLAVALLGLALCASTQAACKDVAIANCFEDANCAEDFNTNTCRDKGCNDQFEERACDLSKCEWAERDGFGQCFAKASNLACSSSSYASFQCPKKCMAAFDGCRDIQCTDLTEEACTADAKLGCKFNSNLFRCFGADGPACGDYSFQVRSVCESGGKCFYDVDTQFCVTQGEDVPCDAYFEEGSCKKVTRCDYDVSNFQCFTKGEKPCSFLTQDCKTCASRKDCTFNLAFSSCGDCGKGSDCANEPTEDCPKPIGDTPCAERLTQTDCGATPDCSYNFDSSKCAKASCREVFVESVCNDLDCEWGSSQCGPVDNKNACNEQTAASCPTRCTLENLGAIGEFAATCRDRTCADYFSKDDCVADSDCAFDADIEACYTKGGKPDCEKRSLSADVCQKDTTCEFVEAINLCKEEGSKTPCTFFFMEDDCTAGKCNWFEDASTCTNGDAPACSAYFSSDPCNKQSTCKWTQQGCETCSGADCAATTTAGVSTLPQFTTEAPVTLAPNTDCSAIAADFDKCISPCYLDFNINKCRKAECNDIFLQGECKALSECAWAEGFSRCSAKDTTPGTGCGKLAVSKCPLNRCNVDQDGESCRAISCLDFFDEVNCKASNKGCTFNAKYNACHAGKDVPCTFFDEDGCSAASSRCAYIKELFSCRENGVGVKCSEWFTSAGCSSADDPGNTGSKCAWNSQGTQCLGKGDKVKCDFLSEDACAAFDHCAVGPNRICVACDDPNGCEFDTTTTPAGKECKDRSEIECGSGSGECSYDFDKETCSESECRLVFAKAPCESLGCLFKDNQCAPKDNGEACDTQTRATCPGRCSLDLSTDKCRDLTCQDYGERQNGQDACNADADCTYNEEFFRCFEKGAAISCDIRFSQALCDEDSKCTWFEDANFCGSGATLPCDKAIEQGGCEKDQACEWHSEVFVCTKQGESPACGLYFSEGECNDRSDCVYRGLTCISCSGDECNTGPTLPPNTECKDISSIDACVQPCVFDFATQKCRVSECVDLFSENECDAPCTWVTGSSQCSPKDDGKACDTHDRIGCPIKRCFSGDVDCRDRECKDNFDDTSCTSVTGCTWDKDLFSCYSGKQPPCTAYQEDSCPKPRCTYNADIFQCREPGPIPCDLFFEETPCTAESCAWYAASSVCYVKGEDIPCVRVFDTDACNSLAHCVMKNNQCSACSGSGCDVVTTTNSPITVGTPCDQRDEQECFNSQLCKYDVVGSACASAQCTELFGEAPCTALDCEWSPSRSACGGKDDGKACSTHTGGECPVRCALDFSQGDTTSCRDIKCTDFYDSAGCASKKSCSFDADVGVCIDSSAEIPCTDRFGGESVCLKDTTCEFDESVAYCKPKGTITPCAQYFDETTCGKAPAGCKFENFVCIPGSGVTTTQPATASPTTTGGSGNVDCQSDKNCKSCPGAGQACKTCDNFVYLQNGVCVDKCLNGQADFGSKKAGRTCVDPFMCKLADGCECPLGACQDCDIKADGAVCLKCDDSRFLSEGKCPKTLLCRGAAFDLGGEEPGAKCHCRWDDEKNCHACTFSNGAANPTKTCTRCKNSMYLQDGRCVAADACKAPLIAANAATFGRLCTDPFTCKKSKVLDDGPEKGKRCTCSDKKSCHTCKWGADGDACIKCLAKQYLDPETGICGDTCPGGTSYGGFGGVGRFCSKTEFNCNGGKHAVSGDKCRCSDSKVCSNCLYKIGNTPGQSFCTKCKGKKVPDANGVCVKAP